VGNENLVSRRQQELAEELGITSHLLLYLEGKQVKVVGNLSLEALAPILTEILVKRMIK